MDCIWATSVNLTWGVAALQTVVLNMQRWASRLLKPKIQDWVLQALQTPFPSPQTLPRALPQALLQGHTASEEDDNDYEERYSTPTRRFESTAQSGSHSSSRSVLHYPSLPHTNSMRPTRQNDFSPSINSSLELTKSIDFPTALPEFISFGKPGTSKSSKYPLPLMKPLNRHPKGQSDPKSPVFFEFPKTSNPLNFGKKQNHDFVFNIDQISQTLDSIALDESSKESRLNDHIHLKEPNPISDDPKDEHGFFRFINRPFGFRGTNGVHYIASESSDISMPPKAPAAEEARSPDPASIQTPTPPTSMFSFRFEAPSSSERTDTGTPLPLRSRQVEESPKPEGPADQIMTPTFVDSLKYEIRKFRRELSAFKEDLLKEPYRRDLSTVNLLSANPIPQNNNFNIKAKGDNTSNHANITGKSDDYSNEVLTEDSSHRSAPEKTSSDNSEQGGTEDGDSVWRSFGSREYRPGSRPESEDDDSDFPDFRSEDEISIGQGEHGLSNSGNEGDEKEDEVEDEDRDEDEHGNEGNDTLLKFGSWECRKCRNWVNVPG